MITKVTLRQKPISGDRQSLYLDFYPPIKHPDTGKVTRREFLNLTVFNESEFSEETYYDKKGKKLIRFTQVLDSKGNPKRKKLSPLMKESNRENLELAEMIRQKRSAQMNKKEIYTPLEMEQKRINELGNLDFLEYFEVQMNKHKKYRQRHMWYGTLMYLKEYCKGQLKFADLNEKFCLGFKDYLSETKGLRHGKRLAVNTCRMYFSKFKSCLIQAHKEDILIKNLSFKIQNFSFVAPKRERLSFEELNRLISTPCRNDTLKRASLFAVSTGLRFSDIEKMVWGEVHYSLEQGFYISIIVKKTQKPFTIYIDEQTYSLLGKEGEANERIFKLKYWNTQSKPFRDWLDQAGIKKKFTFHCFRHSFATLHRDIGTDAYTLKDLMGHESFSSTQIYGKNNPHKIRKEQHSFLTRIQTLNIKDNGLHDSITDLA